MAANAHGMADLIANAESSALMHLFLIIRKQKKVAVNFGLKSSESAGSFKRMDYSVLVYASKDMVSLSIPFVQSLLFNEIATVLVTDENIRHGKVSEMIREHFNYALKRKYISSAEVDSRMKLLSVCGDAGVMRCVEDSGCGSVIVVSASSQRGSSLDKVHKHFSKVLRIYSLCNTLSYA